MATVGDVVTFKMYIASRDDLLTPIETITDNFRIYIGQRSNTTTWPSGYTTKDVFQSLVVDGLIGSDILAGVNSGTTSIDAVLNGVSVPFTPVTYSVSGSYNSTYRTVLLEPISGYYMDIPMSISGLSTTMYDNNNVIIATGSQWSLGDTGAHELGILLNNTTSSGAYGSFYSYPGANGRLIASSNSLIGLDSSGVSWLTALQIAGEPPTDVIKYLTAEFPFPVAGEPLATSVDVIRSDTGEVSAGNITWLKSDGTEVTGNAEYAEKYVARFTVNATGAKFAQAIAQHIVINNTAEDSDVFILSTGAQFANEEGTALGIGVNFSPVGQKTPYDDIPEVPDDPIDEPELPAITAVDTGFVSIYNPSLEQVKTLATYMWNADVTTLDFWRKLVADPMDLILGFSILPCAVPDGGAKSVVVGLIDTGVSMTTAASQFVKVDCGSVTVSPIYNTYLDYAPFTTISLYLPFIGVKQINTDEIMGKTVSVRYHIDILTGACCAYVIVGGSVMYCFTGQCATPLPITSAQYSDMIRSAVQLTTAIGTAVATGNVISATDTSSALARARTNLQLTNLAGNVANAGVNAGLNIKPEIERSGALGSSAGLMAVQTPYFIFNRPRASMPPNQNVTQGYPSNQYLQLGSCSGFTQVQSIRLENIPCTADELSEIYSALESGVII